MNTEIKFDSPVRLDQGTTPTITVELDEDILVTDLKEIWLYIYDDAYAIMLDKNIEDMILDSENNAVLVPLSQEDTLKFVPGNARIELRLLDNNDVAYKSESIKVDIVGAGKDGVIGEEEEEEEEVVITPDIEEEGER